MIIGFHNAVHPVALHYHTQSECILPIENSCSVRCAGQHFTVLPQQCLFIPAGSQHDQVNNGQCTNYYLKMHNLEKIFGSSVQLFDLGDEELLLRWAQDLHLLYGQADVSMESCMQSLTQAWVDRLSQFAQVKVQSSREFSPVQKVMRYMCEHYADELSLGDLAQVAEISASHLRLLFRTELSSTVMKELLTIRMRHACRLLRDDYRQISEVATLTGFSDANYFSRQFRVYHGCSPKTWRLAD
ncbi:MAG: helix-turn-helix transcriptional regulator [Planctomycetes bacterium]|nr:helix-turn-helix transcriptional regulator [Planctomycetota bacterium]